MPRNSVDFRPQTIINPRITMCGGISSDGECVYSLMQANSNNDTMELFYFRMIEHLEQKDPCFRSNTVFVLDGAAWHVSENTLQLF